MGCLMMVGLTGVVLALGLGISTLTALFMGLAASWVTSVTSLIALLLVLI